MIEPGAAGRVRVLVVAGLCVAVASVYLRTAEFDILQYEDPALTVSNPLLAESPGWESIKALFIPGNVGRWSPLAMAALALDVRLSGGDPHLIHILNILWHALNSVLLLFVLDRITCRTLRSGIVALIFAVHPLTVESVAWISGRSTLLAASLLHAGLWALARPDSAYSRPARTAGFFAIVVAGAASPAAAGALALIYSARMFSTRPHVFRTSPQEKAVLIGAGLFSIFANIVAQLASGTSDSLQRYSLIARCSDAVDLFGLTILHAVWPIDLAPMYASSGQIWPSVIFFALVLCAIAGYAVGFNSRVPALAAGGIWFGGMMAPAALLVMFGGTKSDSAAYLALPGLIAGAVFGFQQAAFSSTWSRAAGASAMIAVLVLATLSTRQVMIWKTDIILFRHAIGVGGASTRAEEALGNGFRRYGYYPEAADAYKRGLALNPESRTLNDNLGIARARQAAWFAAKDEFTLAHAADSESEKIEASLHAMEGAAERAERRIREQHAALEGAPEDPRFIADLGTLYLSTGRWKDALAHFHFHSEFYGDDIHRLEAEAYAQLGDLNDAIAAYDSALTLSPADQQLRYERARVLYRTGREEEARDEMLALVQSEPWNPSAWLYLELVFGG